MSKLRKWLAGCLMALASGVAQSQEAKEYNPPEPDRLASAGCKHADMMASMDQHVREMHAMRDKMAAATTPQEREALMAEHMKTMQETMARMKRMGCMAMMERMDSSPSK